MLRGSPSVGGVLIGRDPEGDPLNFTGWNPDNDQFEIILERSGEKVSIGRFPKDIIQRALAYASDGRPCTVTILNVNGVYAQKIALHPALVDTQVGSDAIALDSFAFHFIESDPSMSAWWNNVQASVENQNELYALAQKVRVLGARDEPENVISAICRQSGPGADAARKDFIVQGDKAIGLLKRKTEFYDPELVALICEVALETKTLDDFCAQLAVRAKLKAEGLKKEKQQQWLAEPPALVGCRAFAKRPIRLTRTSIFSDQMIAGRRLSPSSLYCKLYLPRLPHSFPQVFR
jgi:hypothetical protein